MISSATDPGIMLGDADNTGVGTGPGPVRHPSPLTAADLCLQLENEQEAVVSLWKSLVCEGIEVLIMTSQVNRLTRELSTIRQPTAAVISTNIFTSNRSGRISYEL